MLILTVSRWAQGLRYMLTLPSSFSDVIEGSATMLTGWEDCGRNGKTIRGASSRSLKLMAHGPIGVPHQFIDINSSITIRRTAYAEVT